MSSSSTVPHYSQAQTYVLEYLVYICAPWSVAGSALIMWVILYERKLLLKSVFRRIMLGMSLLDFLTSASVLVLGPWAVPDEVDYVVNARGTFSTCAVSGFFLNFLFGTIFYSATLAVHFVMLIRYGKSEQWIARYIEPFGHVIAIGYPLVGGILGIVHEAFNPLPELPGWCWFTEYPPNCSSDPTMECRRGHDLPALISIAADLVILAFIFIVILLSMVLILCKVRDTERRIQRYAGSADQQHAYERTKEVGRQALLYIGAFFLTYFPIGGIQMLGNDDTRKHFAFAVLVKSLSTMQGLFNAIIFLRNQYRALTAQGESLYFLRRLNRNKPADTDASYQFPAENTSSMEKVNRKNENEFTKSTTIDETEATR